MNQLIPNNFSRASQKSNPRGVFLNGGPDGAFPFVTYLEYGRAAFAWCALFSAYAQRRAQCLPEPVVGWSGGGHIAAGYVAPRFHGDQPEFFVRNRPTNPRYAAALDAIRTMPLQNEPARMTWPRRKPAAGNWAPSRWFVQPRPFGEGYDVCTYVALGRLFPASSYPLKLVVVALGGYADGPFRRAQDALALATQLNQTPTWFPPAGAWQLVTETELGPGREVPRARQQPRPLSELWEALKETAGACWLYVRYLKRKIVMYLTK
jgi:hypothetical protein